MGVIDHPQPGQNAASAGITVPQCGHFTESCTGFAELFAGLDKAASIRSLYIAGIAAFFANAVNLKRVAGGNVMVLTDSAGWADQGDVRGRVVGVPIRRLGWPVVDRAGASADRADIPGFQPAVVDAAIPTAGFASADASGDLSPERFPARARTHRLAD